ncbi:cysteine desulfurase [Pseudaminobacter sp. 19-2017]|uniref:Cysteine desulfurase n=1 Tax=Pseudaminobacter soli (ex Zhang et al. 2022) TaxID=2831468 RepID=A0A942DYE0_9HYPH|nr:cysteine desulfurase family protein [Pseudaminobacter soli]MBS3647275.1 cysteine desulfurase [Pseudaminobacter soli]
MAERRVYLDYNATAPLLPEARQAALAALDLVGNPSSVHAEGRAARRIIETARADVAALVGGSPENVVFTSGATEASTTLLTPDWRLGRAPLRLSHLYVCTADHPCLLSGGRFPAERITPIGVDSNGLLRLDELKAALQAHDAAEGLPLVAVHLANNESGVIQPAGEIAEVVKAAGGVLVLDAVQAAGRISLDLTDGCGDFLILSAHKIGGPKGVGAFVGRSNLMMPNPLVAGGGQEKGFRAGTENLPGIAGFGAAAKRARSALDHVGSLRSLRDRIVGSVLRLAPDAEIFGRSVDRIANTVFFAVPGVKAETAQIAFDLAGISLSAGSACSSGKVGPSHVLKAMGVTQPEGGLRVSIGEGTSEEDIARFEAVLEQIVSRRNKTQQAA